MLTTDREFNAFKGFEVMCTVSQSIMAHCVWPVGKHASGSECIIKPRVSHSRLTLYDVYAVQMKNPINESDIQPVRVGRLVSRTPQFTTINVQGRNVKVSVPSHKTLLPFGVLQCSD